MTARLRANPVGGPVGHYVWSPPGPQRTVRSAAMAGPADSWQALAAATQPSQRDKRGQDLRGPPPARSARMRVTMNPIYSTTQLLAGLTASACPLAAYP